MEQGRTCSKCGEWKIYAEFNKDKYKKTGYKPHCKECVKKHFQENKEEILKQRKQYRQDNKEKIAQQKKLYYQDNKESILEHQQQYRQENKEQIAEYMKQYYQSVQGRETRYRGNLKRRSNKNNVEFKSHERLKLLERDNWQCQCCSITVHNNKKNTPDKAHIDHIIPISKGGNSEPSNLQVLCRTCNLTKGAKLELINT